MSLLTSLSLSRRSSSIHEAFKSMDKDRSGTLSASELKQVLDSYAYRVPDEVFANMLGLFDADGDGEISYHEFMTQVKRANGQSGYNADLSGSGGQQETQAGEGATHGGDRSRFKKNIAQQKKIDAKSKTMKMLLTKVRSGESDAKSSERRANAVQTS